jgi:hypothetical protein
MSSPNPLSDAAEKKTHQHGAAHEAADAASGEEETVRTNVDVPRSTYEAFRQRCKREGRPMTTVLRRFIEEYAAERDDVF